MLGPIPLFKFPPPLSLLLKWISTQFRRRSTPTLQSPHPMTAHTHKKAQEIMTGRNTGDGAQFVRGRCRSPSLAAHANVQTHGRRVQQRRAATGRTRQTSLTRLILNSRKHHTWAMPVCSLGAAATTFCCVLFLLPASSCASCCIP